MYMLKRRGAKIDPCRRPFFRRWILLGLLSPVVRVELLFRTSSMIIWIMCLSGRSLSSLQMRPRCQTVSQAAVRSTNTARAFFFASKKSLMFCVSKTTRSTVDFPCRNPVCSFGSKGSTIGSTSLYISRSMIL